MHRLRPCWVRLAPALYPTTTRLAMPTRRVRASRAISRRLFRIEVMVCALADWHRWRVRHALNLAFRWRDRDHCGLCADWEARQGREPDWLDDLRRQGWL